MLCSELLLAETEDITLTTHPHKSEAISCAACTGRTTPDQWIISRIVLNFDHRNRTALLKMERPRLETSHCRLYHLMGLEPPQEKAEAVI
jgi:hypothetical protein